VAEKSEKSEKSEKRIDATGLFRLVGQFFWTHVTKKSEKSERVSGYDTSFFLIFA
jgi:hypothetical protein